MPFNKTTHEFDVAILGTGAGGTLLGAILARYGVRVLLLEQGSHPRFAIGESTIPETTILLRLLAKRYSVPEIAYLSNFYSVHAKVSSACGVKRNFSFCYHRSGEPHRPQESTQYPTLAPPYVPDVHYYRQDVDAFMLATAISYGATAQQQTKIKEISIDSTGVRLCTDKGEEYRAKYVIDAGGIQAPIAQMLNLREEPCPLKTHSRSIFTHMIGVTPYDQCGPQRSEHGLPSPFSQGTLHHIFKGGWMWVIPFNNHPTSTNPLCSVGITLDLTEYPRKGIAPEQEFWDIIGNFPSIAKQFEKAEPVRNWIATDRLQFSSKQITGERYCLLPHAASFVDPLFSSGLAITMSTINVLAHRLIKAVRENDFSVEPFQYIDIWVKKSFGFYDQLVLLLHRIFQLRVMECLAPSLVD
jgi:FADH2 O2-dependent halogenase